MKTLRVPAIEVRQGKRTLYTLAIDSKTIADVATASRIKRCLHGPAHMIWKAIV